jgi:hypothetical protein
MLTKYLNTIPKEAVTMSAPNKYQIRDPHSGMIGLQVIDRYVCGVINCPDGKTRDRYLQEMTANLLK